MKNKITNKRTLDASIKCPNGVIYTFSARCICQNKYILRSNFYFPTITLHFYCTTDVGTLKQIYEYNDTPLLLMINNSSNRHQNTLPFSRNC